MRRYIVILLSYFLLVLGLIFFLAAKVETAEVIKWSDKATPDAYAFSKEFAKNQKIDIPPTLKQVNMRVRAIEKWSVLLIEQKFPHLKGKLQPLRAAKDVYHIVEAETGWINFPKLDPIKIKGVTHYRSLGWISMRKTTATFLGQYYFNETFNESKFLADDEMQARYLLAYYYHKYSIFYDRFKTILSYKYGDASEYNLRYSSYHTTIIGRIILADQRWSE